MAETSQLSTIPQESINNIHVRSRSMAKNITSSNNNAESNDSLNTRTPSVVEALTNAEYSGIPVLKCKFATEDGSYLTATVLHKNKVIFSFNLCAVNSERLLESLLLKLNEMADEHKVKMIKLSTDSILCSRHKPNEISVMQCMSPLEIESLCLNCTVFVRKPRTFW